MKCRAARMWTSPAWHGCRGPFHQMTEMLPVQGVTVVGPLPKELNKVTIYSRALMKGARPSSIAASALRRGTRRR